MSGVSFFLWKKISGIVSCRTDDGSGFSLAFCVHLRYNVKNHTIWRIK